jgi:outer membrane protein TolC
VRHQAGTTPKVALLRAQIDRSKAEEDLKRSQNALATAKLALATLLDRPGADFDVEYPPEPKVSTDPAGLEKTAMDERPDVKAAQEGLDLAEGLRNGVWFRYAPSLGAFGNYRWANIEGFTGKRTAWAFGLALTWSLFDGGLREAELRENQAKVVEARAGKRSADARAIEDVHRALLDLDSARANRSKAKEVVDLARENQKLVEVNFKAGAATYIEVADATESLRQAELAQVAESLAADLAAIRVQKAAGLFKPGTPF